MEVAAAFFYLARKGLGILAGEFSQLLRDQYGEAIQVVCVSIEFGGENCGSQVNLRATFGNRSPPLASGSHRLVCLEEKWGKIQELASFIEEPLGSLFTAVLFISASAPINTCFPSLEA